MEKKTSKIPNGQPEIIKSEDRQDHGQQNERKDKHRTHNTKSDFQTEKEVLKYTQVEITSQIHR